MIKLAGSIVLLAALISAPNDRFNKYKSLASYETKTGIQIVPRYSESGAVCEISIDRRAYYDDRVTVKPTISKDEAIALFQQLVPSVERGAPGWKLPEGSDFTEVDGGTRATHVIYENVSLIMYGEEHNDRYTVAIISWKNIECKKN